MPKAGATFAAGMPPRLLGKEAGIVPICVQDGKTLAGASSGNAVGKVTVPPTVVVSGATAQVACITGDCYKISSGTGATKTHGLVLTRPAAFTAVAADTEPCQGSWIEFSAMGTTTNWGAISTNKTEI